MKAIAALKIIAKINLLFPILINYNGCVFGENIPFNQGILAYKFAVRVRKKNYFVC